MKKEVLAKYTKPFPRSLKLQISGIYYSLKKFLESYYFVYFLIVRLNLEARTNSCN